LACFLNGLTILLETCLDEIRGESCGHLSVHDSFCS
jgi:hypothetical protein